jgi:hypothetical protein
MTAAQLMQNIDAAQLNLSSSHIDATATISGTSQDTGAVNMVMGITGDIDLHTKSMYMNETLTMSMAIAGSPENDNMNTQMYILNNSIYIGTNMMSGNMTWYKTSLTDTIWTHEQSALLQYKDLLKDAVQINVVGEENVNGVDCWKVDVRPDMQKILNWYQTTLAGDSGNLSSGMDLSKLFKNVKITEWIAKDTFYPIKVDMTMSMDIEGVVANVQMTTSQSNFNQPVTITLPAAAAKAQDISSLSQQ